MPSPWPLAIIAAVGIALVLLHVAGPRLFRGSLRLRKAFWCPFRGEPVRVDFDESAWDGRRLDVLRCSAFTPATDVRCEKMCLVLQRLPSHRGPGARGFTLLEIVIVLVVLALLAAVLVPMGYQLFTAERRSVLEAELSELRAAIVGEPDKGTFGYVGDVGRFPGSLLDLVTAPHDASGTPRRGWRGPYVRNPRLENDLYLDPLARPYEYFLRPLAGGVGNQLALVSRGEDGLSSNTTVNPNVARDYTGPGPTDPAYAADPRNRDNVIFPAPGKPDALDVVVSGDVALNIMNFDANPRVNAFVAACPQLFTVTATSIARDTVEARLPHAPGLAFDLVQGQYRLAVAAAGRQAAAMTETVTVLPASTLTRTYNLTGLDSSGTPRVTLTLQNRFGVDVDVYEFDSLLSGSKGLRAGETGSYPVHACAQVYVRQRPTSAVLDQFVMPYGAFTRRGGGPAASLTVVNRIEERLEVARDQVILGTVPRGDVHDDAGASHPHVKTRGFTGLTAGDLIEIRGDQDGTPLARFSLAPGDNTVTVE